VFGHVLSEPREAGVLGTLDEQLRAADPAARIRPDETVPLIAAMTAQLSREPVRRRSWWQNWKVTLPIGFVGVLAVTGAGIAAPLILAVGEPGNEVELDARIPITYMTESGVTVNCVYGVYLTGGSGRTVDSERAAEFLANEDWTGVGQEIYDFAIAHPVTPQEGEVWTNDTPEVRDAISFKLAVVPVISSHLPAELREVGSQLASTDTCTGPFR
jgi:hypothetical protein